MSNDNSNANVVKNDNEIIRYTELTTQERTKLKKATIGRGKLKPALLSMDISPLTISRAIAGMKVTTYNADKIRTFLNSL